MEIKPYPPIVYRGAKEICAAVGVPWKEIHTYVKEHQLPAFRQGGNGMWIAVPEDLAAWIRGQRDKYLALSPELSPEI